MNKEEYEDMIGWLYAIANTENGKAIEMGFSGSVIADKVRMAINYINTLQQEKEELIDCLKEKLSSINSIINQTEDEEKKYYFLIRRDAFKEILDRIEKSDK